MRSALYLGKDKIKLTEARLPEVGPTDVLLKNLNAGICGTDVAVFEHGPGTGHKISVGETFGHEMVSEVVAIGKEVKYFKVGQRVYPYPVYAAGNPSRAGMLGGFAEYLLIKNAKLNRELYLVPNQLTNEVAALTEPFTVATRAVKRAYPEKGESACVYGAGTIGMAAAFALRHLGCERIMVVDHSDFRLKLAEQFGFNGVNSDKVDLRTAQLKYFGKGISLNGDQANININIDAVGAPEILQEFLDSQVVDSRFVMVGVDNHIKKIDLLKMTFASQTLIGSGGYRPSDVQTVFEILTNDQEKIRKMVSKVYPWEELEQAIKIASNPDQVLNVQIKY